jgi:AcrR family transcriptional regulator
MSRTRTHKPKDPLLNRILESGPAQGDETSERILAAAIEQTEDFGVRRFTIDDVARRVGVSRVTIYRYFPKKDRLIEAVILHELRRFLRDIDEAVAPYETLEERLVEGFVFALTYLRDHRLLNRMLRTEPEFILPYLTVRAAPILAAGREFIAGFARREAKEGGLPLTPDSVLGLRTGPEIRRFAEHYLAPTLQAISALPKPATP